MENLVKNSEIEKVIYEIRGQHVMLDSDLARLYECKNGTKTINQAVKRHLNKFPERYVFQLTKDEYLNLKSQVGTSSIQNQYGGIRKMPYAFTEQGVAMLATVLKTAVADIVSMQIIDAFVYLKKYYNFESKDKIILNHEERLLKIEELLNKMTIKNNKNTIIYEDKIYDAYSVLIDIFNEAKKEIIIIDNYANKELFDILKNIDLNIIIISKNIDDVLVKKYNKQYTNIKYINYTLFHDRYIILDRNKIYNSGMSLKDLGKKYTFIYEMTEDIFITDILKRINDILKDNMLSKNN